MTMNRLRKWPLKESVDRLCEEDRREPISRLNRTRKGTFIQPSQESVDLSIFSVSRQQFYCSCHEGPIRLLKGQPNKSGYQVSRDRFRSLSTEAAEPARMKARVDSAEPIEMKSRALTAEPPRTKERSDSEEPAETEPIIDSTCAPHIISK